MRGRLYGCHVSAAGGLGNALRNAQKLEVNTIQLHASPPQRWNLKPFPAGVEDEYLTLLPSSGVERVFFHAIYLINLASSEKANVERSQLSLIHALDLMSRIGGDGVIVHVGSLKGGIEERVGLRRAATAINQLLDRTEGDAPLLLEVAAGSGSIIGDRMEELAEIRSQIENRRRIGFVLDTQHLWASGYNFVLDLDAFVKTADKVLGLACVRAIHLNDSKTAFGSRTDRHENIGDGTIGRDGLKSFFLHPKLATVPFILETPSMKSLDTAALEVGKLRKFLGKKK